MTGFNFLLKLLEFIGIANNHFSFSVTVMHCEHFKCTVSISVISISNRHMENFLSQTTYFSNSETLDKGCLSSLTPRMGKSVQTKVRSGRSIYQKTSVSSAYSQLGGRVLSGPSAKIAQGHLINQRENRPVGPGWIRHVLTIGWD